MDTTAQQPLTFDERDLKEAIFRCSKPLSLEAIGDRILAHDVACYLFSQAESKGDDADLKLATYIRTYFSRNRLDAFDYWRKEVGKVRARIVEKRKKGASVTVTEMVQ